MTQLVKPVCALTEAIKPLLPPLLVQVADHRVLEGFLKYGQTLSDNHKPLRKKVVHHIQELIDALNYNEWELLDLRRHENHFELMFQALERRHTYIRHLSELLDLVPDLTFEELTYKEGHSEADQLRADLAAAQARVAELEAENAALRTQVNPETHGKAALWDGLMGLARLRVMGWAGMNADGTPEEKTYYGEPFTGYAHLGLELWTRYPDIQAYPAELASHERAKDLLAGIVRISLSHPAPAAAPEGA